MRIGKLIEQDENMRYRKKVSTQERGKERSQDEVQIRA